MYTCEKPSRVHHLEYYPVEEDVIPEEKKIKQKDAPPGAEGHTTEGYSALI